MESNNPTLMRNLSLTDTDNSSDPFFTPLASDLGDDEEDDIIASWNLAKRQCEQNLNAPDFAKLQDFPTPEKLAEDLRTKELLRPNFLYVRRPIKTMKSFFQFFVVTMSPRNIESSIFWGLFYLLVELADSQKDVESRWNDTLDMLEKVTRSLDVCRRSHANLPFDEEMKLALNDAFIALITLWAEAIKLMRDNPYESTSDIQRSFDRAIRKVNECFDHLKLCATTRGPHSQDMDLALEPGYLKALLPPNLDLPCGGAPIYNDETFFGRHDVLNQIDEELSLSPEKELKYFTICGLGGVGKSRVALAYAKRYRAQFDVTLWIKSENQISLSQSFTEIAVCLRIPGADKNGKGDENTHLLFEYLNKHATSWLMIWDNLESMNLIRKYLTMANSSASMLVTTRYPEEALYLRARGPVFQLEPFSLADSRALFAKELGPKYPYTNDTKEKAAVDLILQKMGGLAIGICTIAVRIRIKGLTIETFVNRYQKGRIRSDRPELDDYDLTLETLFNDSFTSLKGEWESEELEGFRMLGVLIFCAPDKIPKELFVGPQLDRLTDVPRFCHDDDEYIEAMDPLRRHGLINADPEVKDFNSISIHRLVQSGFRKFLTKEELQTYFDLTVRLVHRAFPKQIEGRPLHLQWDDCRVFIQHGVSLADVYNESQTTTRPLRAPEDLAKLLHSCTWYLFEIGEESECIRITNIALQAVEKNSVLHGNLHNSLKVTYQQQNKLALTRKHSIASREIMGRSLDETSELYVAMLSNWANVLFAEGRTEDSLNEFLKIEKYREQFQHPKNIVLAFVNLGICRAELFKGNTEEAEKRALAATEVIKRAHGERGKYMDDMYFALGNVHLRKSKFATAEEYYQKALELVQERSTTNIFNAAILYKLACVKMSESKLEEAKILLERALDIAVCNKTDGEEARILHKMAELYQLMESPLESNKAVDFEARAKHLKKAVEDDFGDLVNDPSVILNEQQQYDRLVCWLHR